ncbi:hypothetical protein [Rhodococcus opacus]|uniref:hypothetical protein n=1 Tax=Rhodococcus opacus TaxID=37919 RepID=UPI00223699DD|nr:hypothetical protein [Rhodococcus opacus]UZG60458.1 hypothetical protein ONE62_43190 [Rhodococcus opacus]
MTCDAVAEDSDAAQARVFFDQLDAEIDIISARIETVEALTECARRANRLTDRLRAEVAALRAELYEVHRLIDAIMLRFPEVMTRDASAPHCPPGNGARVTGTGPAGPCEEPATLPPSRHTVAKR